MSFLLLALTPRPHDPRKGDNYWRNPNIKIYNLIASFQKIHKLYGQSHISQYQQWPKSGGSSERDGGEDGVDGVGGEGGEEGLFAQ